MLIRSLWLNGALLSEIALTILGTVIMSVPLALVIILVCIWQ